MHISEKIGFHRENYRELITCTTYFPLRFQSSNIRGPYIHKLNIIYLSSMVIVYVHDRTSSVFVCVCVREKKREKERERDDIAQ